MAAAWRKCCAFVTIFIVLMALVIFIALTSKTYTCDLIHKEPDYNLTAIKNVHSLDLSALANFAGHIEYDLQAAVPYNPSQLQRILTRLYLPLNIDFISLIELRKGSYGFTIVADCAELLFDVEADAKKLRVRSISISFSKPNMDAVQCRVEEPPIEMAEDGYYSCRTKKVYKCEFNQNSALEDDDHPGLIVMLVVERLEFEIQGDPNRVRTNEFTKKINPCIA